MAAQLVHSVGSPLIIRHFSAPSFHTLSHFSDLLDSRNLSFLADCVDVTRSVTSRSLRTDAGIVFMVSGFKPERDP